MQGESYEKAAILGPGLIGASIGLALKQRSLARQVVGLARRASTLETAKSAGAIDSGTTRIEEALEGADLVVFAAPVLATIELIERTGSLVSMLRRIPGRRPLLTDTSSTKAEVVEAARRSLPAEVDFIGGHPMAGGELPGPEHGRGDLFVGATWVLTPTCDTAQETISRGKALAQALGSRVLLLSPQVHDEIVSVVSHLPHLLSVALMGEAADLASRHPETWQVAASGFRDTTRLSASSPELWRDVCLTNCGPIADAVAAFRQRLEEMEAWLRQRQGRELERALAEAQRQRIELKEQESHVLQTLRDGQ